MSRISSTQQAHFVQNDRLDNLYLAYRSASRNSPNSAAQGVFTRNSTLLVFLTRLQWQPDGEPPIPGNLQVWKEILSRKSSSNNTRGRPAGLLAPTSAEQFLQALAASSIAESPGNPLQIYLMLSAIDAGKPPKTNYLKQPCACSLASSTSSTPGTPSSLSFQPWTTRPSPLSSMGRSKSASSRIPLCAPMRSAHFKPRSGSGRSLHARDRFPTGP